MIESVLFLVIGFNCISDTLYFAELDFSTGAPLKYQLIVGINLPVARQVTKAVSPSFTVWFITSGLITGTP